MVFDGQGPLVKRWNGFNGSNRSRLTTRAPLGGANKLTGVGSRDTCVSKNISDLKKTLKRALTLDQEEGIHP